MEVLEMRVADLSPYENNPRKNDGAVEKVAASIKEFGFKVPVVVDSQNVIVAGHTRIKAAALLGLETVPVIKANDLTPEQVKAFRLADNKTAEIAEWDFEKLQQEIQAITDIDMTVFGFAKEVFLEEDAFEDEFDIEESAESQEKITVKRGDIYLLGNHRLMCGDSTNKDDISKLMDGTRAELLFTSPPYADMREYEGGKDLGVEHLAKFIPAYKPYADIQCVNLGIQRKENDIVEYWDEYISAARKCGLKLLAWNIWDKMGTGSVASAVAMVPIRHEWIFVFGDDHEFIFCFGEKAKEINRTWPKKEESIRKGKVYGKVRQADGSMETCLKGDHSHNMKKMESVVQVIVDKTMGGKHPAAFPVKLVAEYVKAFTDKGQSDVEPFSGSGTTIVACEELGRKCFAMEMEPKYVQVAIDRWEQLTGKKAVLINE